MFTEMCFLFILSPVVFALYNTLQPIYKMTCATNIPQKNLKNSLDI